MSAIGGKADIGRTLGNGRDGRADLMVQPLADGSVGSTVASTAAGHYGTQQSWKAMRLTHASRRCPVQ
jgi:hypothetical protein